MLECNVRELIPASTNGGKMNYEVKCRYPLIVRDLVDFVTILRWMEHGKVYVKNNTYTFSYEGGCLVHKIPRELFDMEITDISARGEGSQIDYEIEIKKGEKQ